LERILPLSRRRFLKHSTSAVVVAGFGLSKTASASVEFGAIKIDVVSDGSLTLPGNFIFEPMPKDELAPVLEKHGQSPEQLTPPCNVTLMRSGDRTVLFDVGSGPDFAPNSGILLDSLESLGVSPDDVTDIVFTHAHPDHLWGLLDDFDDPLFPEASYMIGKTEWDYWMNPNTVDAIGEARVSFAVGAQRRLAMIEDNITFFNDGEEIIQGVAARKSFGHTPGHMAFELNSGSQSVMIIGDAIANHHVAFERPEWPSGSDQDQDLASATRVGLLDQLATTKMQIIGYHLKGNGLGRVEKSGSAYRFVEDD